MRITPCHSSSSACAVQLTLAYDNLSGGDSTPSRGLLSTGKYDEKIIESCPWEKSMKPPSPVEMMHACGI